MPALSEVIAQAKAEERARWADALSRAREAHHQWWLESGESGQLTRSIYAELLAGALRENLIEAVPQKRRVP